MLHELRHAVRSLRRSPAFTVATTLTLALGIGGVTAISSVFSAVLLRATPFEDIDRLVMVWETDRYSGTTREPASFPDFVDFESESRTLDRLGALMGSQMTAVTDESAATRVTALAVTHGLLPTLEIRGIRGRVFRPEEDRPGAPPVAIVSARVVRQLFTDRRDPLGQVIRLDDMPHTVVGVMPADGDLGMLQVLSAAAYARAFADQGTRSHVDVWVPLKGSEDRFPRQTHPLFVIGRLASGASLASARDELSGLAAELERRYAVNDGRGVFIESLTDVVFAPVRPALLVLTAAVALVLVTACANVANLLLVRATGRRRETAVRQALGASRGQLLRQFLCEALVLSTLALGAGLGLAWTGLRLLVAIAPADIPRLDEAQLDGPVLGFAVLLSLAVGLVVSLVSVAEPYGRRSKVAHPRFSRFGDGRHGARVALVMTQVALGMVLMVGSGLLVRSFAQLLQVQPGFSTGGVLKAEYQLPPAGYPTAMSRWPDFPETRRFNDELMQRLSAVDATEAVAIAGNHPLDAGSTNSFVVVGREREAREWPEISVRRVTPGYLRSVGLRLVSGRNIDRRDDGLAQPVALVNVAASRRFFPDQNPIGQRLAFWGAERTIVGVIGNEQFQGLEQAPPVAVYLPLAQAPSTNGVYAVLARTSQSPSTFAPTLERIVRELDPAVAPYGVEPLDATLSRSVAQRTFVMTLLVLLAVLALVLAAVGVYGLVSHDVAERTREIGVRLALGSERTEVVALFVRQGVRLLVAGLVGGVAASAVMTQALSSLLFGVTATDAITWLVSILVVLAAGVGATVLPARRAAGVDPVEALRQEALR